MTNKNLSPIILLRKWRLKWLHDPDDFSTEASGRLEDTINWITAAEAHAHEFDPGCKAEVTLHLLGKVLEKAAGELEKASAELAEEVFGTEGTP